MTTAAPPTDPTPPKPDAPAIKQAKDMTDAEYAAAKADFIKANRRKY